MPLGGHPDLVQPQAHGDSLLSEGVDPWDEMFGTQWSGQAGNMAAQAQAGSAGSKVEPGAEVPAAAPASAKAKKGLTPAQLRASRNFRARRKTKMSEMEDEVREKRQMVAQLEAERRRLTSKAHALEAVVSGSEQQQEVLLQQLGDMALSEDSNLSSSAQQATDSTAADGSCTASGSTSHGISPLRSSSNSLGSSVSSQLQQGQELEIDPDVIDLAQHYTYYVQQARPLLHDIDTGVAGPGVRQQVEQLMEDLHSAFQRLALKHRTKIYGLGSINMQTLTKCEPPPESHWRRVVAAWKLRPAAMEGLLACYDVYEGKRAMLLLERAHIAQALAQALAAVTSASAGDLASNSGVGSGSAEAASAAYEELVAEMDRSLAKEHVLEHTFQTSAYTYLERLDVARMCVLTYPYKHDVHKLVSVMRVRKP